MAATYSLTLRKDLGRKLTIEEMDDNFLYLDNGGSGPQGDQGPQGPQGNGTQGPPLVFTNSIGNPLLDGLSVVTGTLVKYNLRKEIKVIASGKASTSFDIIKLIALGADGVNAARAFMLSLGCIQARECNKNTCPVGVATQNKSLSRGLDVEDKKVRVFNYHHAVTEEVKDVLSAMGILDMNDLKPSHIFVRMNNLEVKSYDQLATKFWEKN